MSTGPLYAMGGAHPLALERNDAMRCLATGNRAGKPVEREQQIHTPEVILEICEKVWGHIALDPCASREYNTRAQNEYFDGGLDINWIDNCYVNPPFKDLKKWLAKSIEQHEDADIYEQILLFPVRTNREWWCFYMGENGPVTSVAWLKPLKFHEFKSAFPAPLCLSYTGNEIGLFENAVREAKIAHHIGEGI